MLSLTRISQRFSLHHVLVYLLLGSGLALALALASQYIGGLPPCPLCIWQRWPHAVVIAVAMVGLLLRKNTCIVELCIILGVVSLLVAAGIAGFHAGVEWGFWQGLDSCSGGSGTPTSIEDIRAQLMAAPIVACDQPAWEWQGLTMANLHALYCFALAADAAGFWWLIRYGKKEA